MTAHKFKIGQPVIHWPRRDVLGTVKIHVVTALLPAQSGEFKYRIRRSDGAADLVVGERDLREVKEK
jgi:hypothetical protein